MNRTQLLHQVRELLLKAGFYVSDICSLRPIGFDLIARRDNSLLIIKVLTNINSFPEEVALELKKLASLLNGHPLLIGIHAGNRFIEDEVVYDRFGIQAISTETLKIHLLEGIPLHIYAAPGGYYTNINSEKLKQLRNKHNISLGTFAKSVHVSRRTVRMYEEGMNARVDVAYRIEDLLKEALIETIDILSNKSKEEKDPDKDHKTQENAIEKYQHFQKEIFLILKNAGYIIIPIGRCPFEAVSKDREEILLTCVQRYDQKLPRKAKIISSISKITEKRAVMITDKKGTKDNIEGTPLIVEKELRKLNHPSEVLELILERLCS
jgi:putative transcriptional regulator